MNPRVQQVRTGNDYTLTLTFTNGEIKIFDMKLYLNTGVFTELKNQAVFNSVKPFMGSVQWIHGLDLCPDTLYIESTKTNGISIAAD